MFEAALALALGLLSTASSNPVTDFNSGVAAERRGDLHAAAAWLEQSQRAAPRWALPKLELAEVLLSEGGSSDRALLLLRDAQALDDRNPRLYHLSALALMEKGSSPQAEVMERAALGLKPEFPEAKATLGEALWAQGKREEALTVWRDLNERHPHDTAKRALLVDRLLDDGRGPEAEKQLRWLVAEEPKNPVWHRRLARVLDAEGYGSEAAAERARADALAGTPVTKRKLRRLPDSKR